MQRPLFSRPTNNEKIQIVAALDQRGSDVAIPNIHEDDPYFYE